LHAKKKCLLSLIPNENKRTTMDGPTHPHQALLCFALLLLLLCFCFVSPHKNNISLREDLIWLSGGFVLGESKANKRREK